MRPPQRGDFSSARQFKARLTQHNLWADDLLRYGLHVVEVERFEEVPNLMREIERRVASNRVWISGSWPVTGAPADDTAYVAEVATAVGAALGGSDMALVTGSGLTVSSCSISGFLSALQRAGSWDLERRLIARPFPQPLEGRLPDQSQWAALRTEMARIAGAIIFIGGLKLEAGSFIDAEGVRSELEVARAAGAFCLPIGSTGGTARRIAEEMLGSPTISNQPTKAMLRTLMKKSSPSDIAKFVLFALNKSRNISTQRLT